MFILCYSLAPVWPEIGGPRCGWADGALFITPRAQKASKLFFTVSMFFHLEPNIAPAAGDPLSILATRGRRPAVLLKWNSGEFGVAYNLLHQRGLCLCAEQPFLPCSSLRASWSWLGESKENLSSRRCKNLGWKRRPR